MGSQRSSRWSNWSDLRMIVLTILAIVMAQRILFPVPISLSFVTVSASAQQSTSVERSLAVALIADFMIAINLSNWTGSYTVLRDCAPRNSGDAYDPTRQASLFVPVREAGIDMLPGLIAEIPNSQINAGGK